MSTKIAVTIELDDEGNPIGMEIPNLGEDVIPNVACGLAIATAGVCRGQPEAVKLAILRLMVTQLDDPSLQMSAELVE